MRPADLWSLASVCAGGEPWDWTWLDADRVRFTFTSPDHRDSFRKCVNVLRSHGDRGIYSYCSWDNQVVSSASAGSAVIQVFSAFFERTTVSPRERHVHPDSSACCAGRTIRIAAPGIENVRTTVLGDGSSVRRLRRPEPNLSPPSNRTTMHHPDESLVRWRGRWHGEVFPVG
jgi:hypothetical protein